MYAMFDVCPFPKLRNMSSKKMIPFNNHYKLNMAKLCKFEYFEISYLNNIIGQS